MEEIKINNLDMLAGIVDISKEKNKYSPSLLWDWLNRFNRDWAQEWIVAWQIAGEDVLPNVCNPSYKPHKSTNLTQPFKIPSQLVIENGEKVFTGIPKWYEYKADEDNVRKWASHPCFAPMIRCRQLLGIDVDTENKFIIEKLLNIISNVLNLPHQKLPHRVRANSNRVLYLFYKDFDVYKTVFKLPSNLGIIEFLGDKQVFQFYGTHSSGYNFSWVNLNYTANPPKIPIITNAQYEELLKQIQTELNIEETSIKREYISSKPMNKSTIEKNEEYNKIIKSKMFLFEDKKDGKLFIACPKKHLHTTPTGGKDTVYYPKGYNSQALSKIHCFHESHGVIKVQDLIDCINNTNHKTQILSSSCDLVDSNGVTETYSWDKAKRLHNIPKHVIDNIERIKKFNNFDAPLPNTILSKYKDSSEVFNAIYDSETEVYSHNFKDLLESFLSYDELISFIDARGLITHRKKNLVLKPTIEVLEAVLDAWNLKVGFDNFNQSTAVYHKMLGTIYPTKVFYKTLHSFLKKEYKHFGNVTYEMFLNTFYQKNSDGVFDSVKAWISNQVWDGESRISNFATAVFDLNTDITPYKVANKYFEYFFMVAGARLAGIETKADATIVLSGAQGIGKSTFIRALSPFAKGYCTLNIRNLNKDEVQKTLDATIVEIDEISKLSASARQEDSLKSYLSLTSDVIRLPYEREVINVPRRFMFIGSSNYVRFLNDPTGNRRWLPIALRNKINLEYVVEYLPQLLIEGLIRYFMQNIPYNEIENYARILSPNHLERGVMSHKLASILADIKQEDREDPTISRDIEERGISQTELIKRLNDEGVHISVSLLEVQLHRAMYSIGWMQRKEGEGIYYPINFNTDIESVENASPTSPSSSSAHSAPSSYDQDVDF